MAVDAPTFFEARHCRCGDLGGRQERVVLENTVGNLKHAKIRKSHSVYRDFISWPHCSGGASGSYGVCD